MIVTDNEYPARVAFSLLNKVLDDFMRKYPSTTWSSLTTTFAFDELKAYMLKYQNPNEADTLLKVQKEIDETKIILVTP